MRANGSGAKAAVPALIATLKDKERSPRIWAAIALGAIGAEAKAAVPALRAALKLKDESVRSAAAEAIKNIGQK